MTDVAPETVEALARSIVEQRDPPLAVLISVKEIEALATEVDRLHSLLLRAEEERDVSRKALRRIAESTADEIHRTFGGTQYEWAREVARAALATPEETKEAGEA